MQRVVLVTDSTAGLPPETAAALGIFVVPASFAFAEERFLDGAAVDVYARMADGGAAPRTFGVAEAAFKGAFAEGLRSAEGVVCVVAPFDVNPSFTTACAAMLGIQFDEPEAHIKVSNAGVGGAGLGALMLTLGELCAAGADAAEVLATIDELEPRCDSLYVPADGEWLARAGRLSLVEDRVGPLDGRFPVVRLGTRITGVAAFDDHDSAVEAAIGRVGGRAGDVQLNICISHSGAADCAARTAESVRRRWPAARLEVSEMSPTHGSQLGPGTIGIGVCPVSGREA